VDLVRIQIMLGLHDEAIDSIEKALSVPGVTSATLLRIAPSADPLRDHPRFQRLVGGGAVP
jgi:hypothetical protein